MDDLTQRSKVKLNYELPDEVVEDYTYEMGRLKFKVNTRSCLRFWETQVQGLLIQDIVCVLVKILQGRRVFIVFIVA